MRVPHARVVCLDTVMVDFVLMVAAMPERGGDTRSSRRLLAAGGGFNVMSAARRQGVDVLYAGQLGAGRFSEIARDNLLREGIEMAIDLRGDIDLGVCVVLVDEMGERTFITSPGAELTLQADDLATVTPSSDDVVYLSGYNFVYPEVAPLVSEWLGALPSDIVVAFDPGPRAVDIAPEIMSLVLQRTNWLLCNLAEAQLLADGGGAGDCARHLREQGDFEKVVVRAGAQGCVSSTRNDHVRAPGFESNVIDTNGAGDVHNGVLIAELMRGTSLAEALLRANAAASIAIASFGPATCPTRELVDGLLARQPREVIRL